MPSCRAPIEILVVDDDGMVRRFLSELLNRVPGMKVVGSAANGEQALAAASILKPRVITMDLNLPTMDGLEATRRILDVRPDTRIVILSGCYTSERIRQSWRAGALAYVLKLSSAGELASAVLAVAAGNYYLSGAIGHSLADESRAVSRAYRYRNRRDDGRFGSV
jgi:DNA-binding NarL/FixJ family response regulator